MLGIGVPGEPGAGVEVVPPAPVDGEVVAVVASVIIVEQISSDGESNWMEGVQLLSVYAILAILFYFLPDAQHPAR